jgi:pentatricopeptide repeat protein
VERDVATGGAAEDPRALLERLAACRAPLLLGVRHHSPACAAAIPPLLDAFAPERLFVELPADLQEWLPWLGHRDLEAPVALALADADGAALSFYPFADFSPELAAVRWAVARGVPVEAFDRGRSEERERGGRGREERRGGLLDAFCRAGDADGVESLWDRMVEARAPGAAPEQVRRAALLFGAALRLDAVRAGGADEEDLAREGFMRERLAASSGRAAAVVGAFHAAALLPEPLLWRPPAAPQESSAPAEPRRRGRRPAARRAVSSLVPYAFDLLDSRSGYPAGIRDPAWQQGMLETLGAGLPPEALCERMAVETCRALRAQGHVAGVPDATELARLAGDLARLRGLPAPGRREFLEGVTATLAQGELLGRGRAVARALEQVLVGRRRGQLPEGTPRAGLVPHVEGLLAALRLPPPSAVIDRPEPLRLDPLRSDLDRRRHVALERLAACGVPYGRREAVQGIGDSDALTTAWRIQPTPTTTAMLEAAAIRGVTLAQAAEGALRGARARLAEEDRLGAADRLALVERAAECGLPALAAEGLRELHGPFLSEAGLAQLVAAAALTERILRGHFPGLPLTVEEGSGPGRLTPFVPPPGLDGARLIGAAVAAVEGLAGSDRPEDARGILELVRWFERQPEGPLALGDGRLGAAIDRLAREGSPRMQGAATAARVLLGREEGAAAGVAVGSWVDGGIDPEGRRAMAARLGGLLTVAGPRLEADAGLLGGAIERIEALGTGPFLERLPALRDGFEALSPAARQRLLEAVAARHGLDPRAVRALDAAGAPGPARLALLASVDGAGLAELDRRGLGALARGAAAPEGAHPPPPAALHASRPGELAPIDRWRLVLGRERERLPPELRPAARALEELYGAGHGEGSRGGLPGSGGGEVPYPTVREWSGELEALFGARVREEVLGRAAAGGRAAAALALDPDAVVPSVELLEQVLSLKGAIPEGQLGSLRRLVSRVVDELVRDLARRVTPALTGLTVPRPTRRPGGRLDLGRTVSANLRGARRDAEGRLVVLPEHPRFRSRSRRSLDWRVILVVDVSGSMEPSVIYSALMAAILSALPAVSVDFLAFSTEVLDLTERVADPLGLLLEVVVGGGTDIAKALRAARQRVRVPRRTLVVTVSDFEEGGSVDALVAEVRALREAGVTALGLAALDDGGKARYDVGVAERLVAAGMPVAALTPLELARWVGERIR